MTGLDVGWLEAALTKAKTERDWWRAMAGELAEAVRNDRHGPPHDALGCSACDALRRYEARKERKWASE